MPAVFVVDNSTVASNTYPYTSGYNNTPITSNILFNQQYVNSNTISNILTTYDTISLRNNETSNIYTEERQYPSKAWTSIDTLTTITYNGLNAYSINLTLNTDNITYGSGIYTIIFSNKFVIGGSDYPGSFAYKLFDFITIQDNTNAGDLYDNTVTQYNGSGIYTGNYYLAESSFKGSWIVIKIPFKIKLTKYIIVALSGSLTIRSPGLWKIYGSIDGINWEVINDASNTNTKILVSDYFSNNNTYTKILNTPSKLYNYYGICVSALAGSSGEFSFVEWQLFGKEQKNNFQSDWNTTIINKPDLTQYITSNVLSNQQFINSNFIQNSLSTDFIKAGNSNKFIVNDSYTNDITFKKNVFSSNIITSNLFVIDNYTVLNTSIYQTEQLQITNAATATALKVLQTTTNQNVAEFYNSANPALIINNNGNVGIGTTNPGEKLQVNGNIKIINGNKLRAEGAAGTTAISIGGYGSLEIDASGIIGGRFIVKDSGNVGIGTNNPSYKLHIQDTTNAGLVNMARNLSGGTSAYSAFTVQNDTVNGCWIFLNSSTRTADGGVNTATLRNDAGDLRLQSSASGNAALNIHNGVINIHNGTYWTAIDRMKQGSLSIGSTNSSFGGSFFSGGTWPVGANTAGLLLECVANTEIVVHQFGSKAVSLMYYSNNEITIGRDMGWGNSTNLNLLATNNYLSGNVGIGITNPTEKLQVNGNIYGKSTFLFKEDRGTVDSRNWCIRQNNSYEGAFQIGCTDTNTGSIPDMNTTPSLAKFTILNNGNIGIGTHNPSKKLTVVGQADFSGSTSGSANPLIKITQNAAWDGNYALQISGYTDLGGIRINGGDLGNSIFKVSVGTMGLTTYNGDILFNTNNGNEKMRILNAGNIGIGKTNPGYTLDVAGIINASNIYINGNPFTGGGGSSQWTTSNANIYYNIGNVGIGTVVPTNLLHLHKNSANAYNAIQLTDSTTGISSNSGFIISKESNQDVKIMNCFNANMIFGTSNTEQLRITSNGYIGIGNSNPSYNLDVIGTIKTNSLFVNYTNIAYPPKQCTSFSAVSTTTLLTKSFNLQSIVLDNTNILSGSGTYNIYTNSYYPGYSVKTLFNYSYLTYGEIPNSFAWASGVWTNGIYNNTLSTNTIDNLYYGDVIIVQLPVSIALSSYDIWAIKGNDEEKGRAPGEWKVYGSTNGINFFELSNASHTSTRLTINSYTGSEFKYTKTIIGNSLSYSWYGICVNKLAGTSGLLHMRELRFYANDNLSTIVKNGNVGIGNTNPKVKLQITNGAVGISGNANQGAIITGFNTAPGSLTIGDIQTRYGNKVMINKSIPTSDFIPTITINSSTNLLTNILNTQDYYYSFINTGANTLNIPVNVTCDILIIGGGGSGGCRHGGGGGAGALIYLQNQVLTSGTYTVNIGAGGTAIAAGTTAASGNNGNDTYITLNGSDVYRAKGGGAGNASGGAGIAGGSSGGSVAGNQNFSAAPLINNIPSGTFGNYGGKGCYTSVGPGGYAGGGGGGAGTVGYDGSQSGYPASAGNGGHGKIIDINGVSVYYAGGGGGGCAASSTSAGTGGLGGGGAGSKSNVTAISGTANTGSGGGGSGFDDGSNNGASGAGGSGIVIIRFKFDNFLINNTAGLLMECVDNTEIAVYNNGSSLNSLIYYDNSNITIGRDMGWGSPSNLNLIGCNVNLSGNVNINNKTSGTSLKVIQSSVSQNLAEFYNSSNLALVINNTGTVGINTTIPNTNYKLDVNGIINATDISKNGISITSLISNSAVLNNVIVDVSYCNSFLSNTFYNNSNSTNIYFNNDTLNNIGISKNNYYAVSFSNGNASVQNVSSFPILYNSNLNIINPIVWYKFNSNNFLNDYGSGNYGSLTSFNNTTYSTINKYRGTASASFTASASNYLTMPITTNLYSIQIATGITFSVWAKINTNTGIWGRIFDFGYNLTGSPIILMSRHALNNTINFSNQSNYFTTNSYVDNNWHHYVFTISKTGQWIIYIDGVLASFTTALPTATNLPNYSVAIAYFGKSGVAGDGYLDGNISDFRIYNLDLTATQAAILYKNTNIYTDYSYSIVKDLNNNLIYPTLWYKFENNLLDSSGNDNHLILYAGNYNFSSTIVSKGNYSIKPNPTVTLTSTNNITINNTNTNITVAFWFNVYGLNSEYDSLIYSPGVGQQNLCITRSAGGANKLYFRFAGSAWFQTTTDYYLNDYKWYHLTMIGEKIGAATRISLYINGVFKENNGAGGTGTWASFSEQLGVFTNNYGNPYAYLDDLRVYVGTALTSNQIQELYNGSVNFYHTPKTLNYTDTTTSYTGALSISGNSISNGALMAGYNTISGALTIGDINTRYGGKSIINKTLTNINNIPTITINSSANLLTNIQNTQDYYYSFISAGSNNLILSSKVNCDILIVGGGGSGGCRTGGGGGAGALIYLQNQTLTAGTYSVYVGLGGTAVGGSTGINGINGGDSYIQNSLSADIYRAKGGGGGANPNIGLAGGSSGGSCGGYVFLSQDPLTTNVPVGIYGNYGGKGSTQVSTEISYDAGGGGGAGSPGSNGIATGQCGNGGNGLLININGINTYYAGGGGGGGGSGTTAGTGGLGGGGAGTAGPNTAISGIANTGSGGGGSGYTGSTNGTSGAGGSGIIIIRFKFDKNLANNTAGLLLECADNTEIAVYNKGSNINSLIYYDNSNTTIGRDMGWGNPLNINLIGNNINFNGYTKTSNIEFDYLFSRIDRSYPPKAWNLATPETTTTFLGKLCYKQILTLTSDNITYGSGNYIVYSSTTFGSFFKELLFDYITLTATGGVWAATSYTNGVYTGANTIDGTYFGEWLVIKLPKPIILKSYTFWTRNSYNYLSPGEWKFYGSSDGVSFVEIVDASQTTKIVSASYNGTSYTKNILNYNIPFLYYGFCVNKLTGTDTASYKFLNFTEFRLYGEEATINNTDTPLKITNDLSIGEISNNNEIRQYPPKAYTSFSSVSTVTFLGQTTITLQTITLDTANIEYGSGIYSLYMSSVFSSATQPNNAFDFLSGVNNSGMIFSNNYDQTTGYYNLTTRYINSLYKGEWFVIKLPVSIILKQYSIFIRSAAIWRAPGEWRVYGSIDGANFIEITDANQLTQLTASSYSINTNAYFKNVKNQTTYYNYFGFCFNKIVGGAGGGGDGYLEITEIQLFGSEYPSESYALTVKPNNITTNVNVGIGTIAPANLLHLHKNTSNAYIAIQLTDNTTGITSNSGFIISKESNQDVKIMNCFNANMIFGTSNTEDMRITNNGFVSIDNNNPYINFNVGSNNKNHRIGRAIINATGLHNADKQDSLQIGRWDDSISSVLANGLDPIFTGLKYNVTPGNYTNISFHTWGNSIANSREVMRINHYGYLGINNTNPQYHLDVSGSINATTDIKINNVSLSSTYITSNVLGQQNFINSNFIQNSLSTDFIKAGNSNKFIVNDKYTNDITFTKNIFSSNIITSNLFVIDNYTVLNTSVYQTEQLQITNTATATALKVSQTTANQNVAEFYNSANPALVINSTGNIGIGTTNPQFKIDIPTVDNISTATNVLSFKNTADYGIYATSISTTSRGNSLDFLSKDYNSGTITTRNVLSLKVTGNVGIGTNAPTNLLHLHQNAVTTYNAIQLTDNTTGVSTTNGFIISKETNQDAKIMNCYNANMIFGTSNTETMRIINNGNIGIGITNPLTRLSVKGAVNINNGTQYVGTNNYMKSGSLTIGDITENYGTGGNNWSTNTAGLMLECLANTEIMVHDSGTRLMSLIQYNGDSVNTIVYGRSMNWGYPIGHYFNAQDVFNVYLNGAAASWNNFYIRPTSLWGDAITTASETAGTKFITIGSMMYQNPHIVPSTVGGDALMRFGRAGGISTGTWWELATKTNGNFNIGKEASTTIGVCINPSGNVGIGTSTPTSKLTIRSGYGDGENSGLCLNASDITNSYTLKLYSFIQASGQVGYYFKVNNISSSVNALTFGYSGNIGIGLSLPGYKLDVAGKVNANGLILDGSLTTGTISKTSGTMDIKTAASTAITFTQNTSEIMRIHTNNYIGIGTNAPTGLLHLYGTTAAQARLILAGTEFYTGGTTSTEGIAFLCGVNRSGNRQLWIADSAALASSTTNSTLMIVTQPGSVFINSRATDGTTQLPLDIGGGAITINANSFTTVNKCLSISIAVSDNKATVDARVIASVPIFAAVYGGDNYYNAYWGCAININAGGFANGIGGGNNTQSVIPGYSAFTVNMRTSGSATSFDKNLLTIMPSGNVGIGTTTPTNLLHLHKNSANTYNAIQLTDTTTGVSSTNGFIISKEVNQDVKIMNCFNANMIFGTSNTEDMRILNNGNIGIGKTNPNYILDVAGIINASNIYINGSNFTGGGSSQWITSGSNIYYNSGNLGIGKTNPNYLLDVAGIINANNIYKNGVPLTSLNTSLNDIIYDIKLSNNYFSNNTYFNTNINDVSYIYFNNDINNSIKLLPDTNYTVNFNSNSSNGFGNINLYNVSIFPNVYDTNSNIIKPFVWYKFDKNNVYLDSGSGNNINLTNNDISVYKNTNSFTSTTVKYRGNLSYLLNYTQSTALIMPKTINFQNIQDTVGITFSFWFKNNHTWRTDYMQANIQKVPGSILIIGDVSFISPNSNKINYLNIIHNSSGFFCFSIGLDSSNETLYVSNINCYDNNWHHIIWSISNTGVWTIYIDGINLNVNITKSMYIIPSSSEYIQYWIGDWNDTLNANYCYGYISDFRFYNFPLTNTQILSLYNNTLIYTYNSYNTINNKYNDNITPTIWYKFDNNLLDSSGNNNTLIQTGGNNITFSSNVFYKGSYSLIPSSDIKDTLLQLQSTNNYTIDNITNCITISFWYYIKTTLDSYDTLIYSFTNQNCCIQRSAATNFFAFKFAGSDWFTSTINYSIDYKWHHLVMIGEKINLASRITIYLDGNYISVNNINGSGTWNPYTEKFAVYGGSSAAIANLDDLRVYVGTILTSDEIYNLFNNYATFFHIANNQLTYNESNITNTQLTNNFNVSGNINCRDVYVNDTSLLKIINNKYENNTIIYDESFSNNAIYQTSNYTNNYILFNNNNFINVNSNNYYQIEFKDNNINLYDKTLFPIIYNTKNDNSVYFACHSPAIWFKFDKNNFLANTGLILYANKNLTSGNSCTYTTLNTYRGNASANFIATSNNFLSYVSPGLYNLSYYGMTFTMWAKITSNSGANARLFEFGNNTATNYLSLLKNSSNNIIFTNKSTTAGNSASYIYNAQNLIDNNWHFFAWTINSSNPLIHSNINTWSFYIDNNYINPNISSLIDINNFPSLRSNCIGKSILSDNDSYLDGCINDFRVYSFVLTSNQISTIYNNTLIYTDNSYTILKKDNNITIEPDIWFKFNKNDFLLNSGTEGGLLTNVNNVSYSLISNSGKYSAYFSNISMNDNKYLYFNSKNILGTKSFLFTGWIYNLINPVNTDSAIVSIGLSYFYYNALKLYYDSLNQKYTLIINNTSGNYTEYSVAMANDLNIWIHIMLYLNLNENKIYLYRNGIIITSVQFLYKPEINCSQNIYIGCDQYAANQMYFNGYMCDLRFYIEQNLTTAQIFSIYNKSVKFYHILDNNIKYTEKTLTYNGNIGIGTSAPNYRLDVAGIINASNYYINGSNFTGGVSSQWITSSTNIYYNAGNVGIGFTNPSYKLHVTAGKTVNSTAFAMKISGGVAIFDSGNYGTLLGLGSEDGNFSKCAIGHVRTGSYDRGDIVFLSRTIADTTTCDMTDERMRISSSGYIGIGTTTPSSLLHIKGTNTALTVMSQGGSGTTSQLNLTTYDNLTNAAGCSLIATDDGAYGSTFKINLKTTGANTNTQFTALHITNAGLVGIGNTAPIGTLTLGNSSVIGSDGSLVIGKCSAAGSYRHFKLGIDSSYDFIIGDFGNNNTAAIWYKSFAINYGAPYNSFYINSTGKIGIATNTQTNILQVGAGGRLRIANDASDYTLIGTNDTDGSTNTRIVLSGNTRASYLGQIEYVTINTGSHIFKTGEITERMRILSTGNVGIGTTTPLSKFTIRSPYSDGENSGLCLDATDGTVYNLKLYSFTPAGGQVGYKFKVNNSTSSVDALTFGYNGNIGIGTATPNYPLHVNGNINCTDLLINTTSLTTTLSTKQNTLTAATTLVGDGTAITNLNYNNLFNLPLRFNTLDNSNIYFNSGWVGIGTTNPSCIFQIGAGGRLRIANNSDDYSLIGSSDIQGTSNACIIVYGNTRGAANKGNIEYYATNTGSHIFFSSNSTFERMRITSEGSVGIGVTNPVGLNNLTVGGEIRCFNDIAAFYSDIRLKKITSNITNAVSIITNINAFKYTASDLAINIGLVKEKDKNKQFIGVSAQDVNKVLPEIVSIAPFDLTEDANGNIISKSGENYLTLKYDKLTPILIEAVKELKKEILFNKINSCYNYIPNIYKFCTCISNIIKININISNILKINDKIKIISNEINVNYTVINIIDNNTFIIDNIINDNNVFVYGTYIENIQNLDNNYLLELINNTSDELYKIMNNFYNNISETKELHKLIENLTQRIETLENK